MLRSENRKQYIDPPALQQSAMSIENGILTLPHSSGVLCVLKRYAVSLRKILKIVQSLVVYSKARKYVNISEGGSPAHPRWRGL